MIHHRMAENKACCPECAGLSSSSSSVEKIFSRLMTAECRKSGNFIYPMTPCSLLKRRSSRAGIAGEGGEGEKNIRSHLRGRTRLHRRPSLSPRTKINNDNHERMGPAPADDVGSCATAAPLSLTAQWGCRCTAVKARPCALSSSRCCVCAAGVASFVTS